MAFSSAEKSLTTTPPPQNTPLCMGGGKNHKSYIFIGNIFQLSYGPVNFSGESNSINFLRNDSLVGVCLKTVRGVDQY